MIITFALTFKWSDLRRYDFAIIFLPYSCYSGNYISCSLKNKYNDGVQHNQLHRIKESNDDMSEQHGSDIQKISMDDFKMVAYHQEWDGEA